MEKISIRNKYKLKNNNNEEKPKETKKFEKTEKIVKNQETNFSNNNSYSSKRDNVFNNLYMVKDNKQKDNKIFLSNNYEEELTKEIKESAAARHTFLPCFLYILASFAQVLVLPEPLTPTINITVGPF